MRGWPARVFQLNCLPFYPAAAFLVWPLSLGCSQEAMVPCAVLKRGLGEGTLLGWTLIHLSALPFPRHSL